MWIRTAEGWRRLAFMGDELRAGSRAAGNGADRAAVLAAADAAGAARRAEIEARMAQVGAGEVRAW